MLGVLGLTSSGCGGSDATPAATGEGHFFSTSDGSLPAYAATDVTTAAAACNLADAAFVSYDSEDEMRSLLTGSWYYCGSASSQPLPLGAAGVQFTADGEFRWLVLDASGTLTSAVSPVDLDAPGFAFTPATTVPASEDADGARMNYDFGDFSRQEYSSYGGVVEVFYADRGSMSARATFEASPHRMYLDDWGASFTYVGP
jgi:hypothetical protein